MAIQEADYALTNVNDLTDVAGEKVDVFFY